MPAMTSRHDQETALQQYESLLSKAEDREAQAAKEVTSLQQIVQGLRGLLGLSADRLGETPATARSADGTRPNLMGTVRAIMSDGQERSVKHVLEELVRRDELPKGDDATKRKKVANRLYELTVEGFLEKGIERSLYRLRRDGGS
jgi:hypothetical protein